MNRFRKQIVNGLSDILAETIAETVIKVTASGGVETSAQPAGQALSEGDILDVETVNRSGAIMPVPRPARPALPAAPPVRRPIPPPAQTGARPDPRYPAFPFPAPLDLPPETPAAAAPPAPPSPGPRPRGRPRKNGGNGRPPLFTNANPNARALPGVTQSPVDEPRGIEGADRNKEEE